MGHNTKFWKSFEPFPFINHSRSPFHQFVVLYSSLHNTLLGNRKSTGKDLQAWKKCSRQTLDFMGNRGLPKKVQFVDFSNIFPRLTKFTFWKKDWKLGHNSMKSGDVHYIC